jgi:N-alpha-acetyltransferase 10/11
MDIRLMRTADIPHVQQANITNLPENYFAKYYLYHVLTWPQLSYVAVDVSAFPVTFPYPSLQEFPVALSGSSRAKVALIDDVTVPQLFPLLE